MKIHFPLITTVIVGLPMAMLVAGCNDDASDVAFKEPLPDVVDFNYHVKPILSDTCYLCHGPDVANAKAGLSLSNFDSATSHKTDDGLAALVAGSAKNSAAYRRIMSNDENMVMPPPESNLSLSPREKALIKKWIDQGAEYKKHWSFIAPEKTTLPTPANSDWAANPVDNFILKAIEDKGLTVSSRADKETLIRRITFDLTGLPPTLEEIDAFLADTNPDAYQQVVQRLLATPAFGERLATQWLDVARYADTHGYSTDFYRDMSPYRDWVIQAFNQNMPFDEFVTWQLAGDLLPDPTKEQVLATAFNRIHAQNGEGGIVNEEFRVEYVKDRVQTVGTGLLGLTMHCAQCHDHKYDPISAKEYYATTAFFNNIEESGQISYDANDMPVPSLLLPSDTQQITLTRITQKINTLTAQMKSLYTADNSAFKQWINKNLTTPPRDNEQILVAYYPLTTSDSNDNITNQINNGAPGKVIFGSDPNKKEGEEMVHVSKDGRESIRLNGDDPLYFPHVNGFERAKPFTISLDTQIPDSLEEGVLFHYNKAGILYNFKGFDVSIEDGHWQVRFAHTYPFNAITLTSTEAVKRNQWQNVTLTYDGSSKAAGVNFYIDGQPVKMRVEKDNLYKDFKHTHKGVLKEMGLKIGARWRSRGTPDTLVDNVRVYNADLTHIEVAKAFGEQNSANDFNQQQLLALYNQRYNEDFQQDAARLADLRVQYSGLAEQIQEIMVMKEGPSPKQAYVLNRGSYAEHGEPVEPGVPETVLPFDKSLSKNRLGLAKWLTDAKNPLVSRVVVNRYWQMIYGQGLVTTPEDFGSQGKLPSHPELLDWLAVEFIESGWNVKQLIALMVNSSTYTQSSKGSPELKELDPENTLLARGPSARLTAEMIRDNALASSGLLVKQVGGKSVHPYQPNGIWRMNNMDYVQGSGQDLYRRSMYTIYKRSVPPPNMTAFDAPSRAHSVGVRQATSTPLQALALLNDPQIVEASRVLAQRVLSDTANTEEQLKKVYRLLTSRMPSEAEQALILEMYSEIEQSFSQTPDKAAEFLSVGESPTNTELNQIELAALGTVTNMLINHDASVIKR
ncbi:MAG: DUF1553 domain-containing protein [Paraglaciecola sp.]|uniref:DUF1553 domain-containing protein n=1 Tax=Paraglaciecola sp. TaxID=1920173 RepID=UPI003297F08B